MLAMLKDCKQSKSQPVTSQTSCHTFCWPFLKANEHQQLPRSEIVNRSVDILNTLCVVSCKYIIVTRAQAQSYLPNVDAVVYGLASKFYASCVEGWSDQQSVMWSETPWSLHGELVCQKRHHRFKIAFKILWFDESLTYSGKNQFQWATLHARKFAVLWHHQLNKENVWYSHWTLTQRHCSYKCSPISTLYESPALQEKPKRDCMVICVE